MAEVRTADGTPIILRRHGTPGGPRLVLSHANGFSADTYFLFWSLLIDRFDVVLYDFRNHGWNPTGERQAHTIPTFVRDNECIAQGIDRHFGTKPKIGVFHSLSAQTAVLQAAEQAAFSALVLFDPVLCPPGRSLQDLKKLETTMLRLGKAARRRQERFETQEEFAARIRGTPTFELLQPGVTDLIARTTLRRDSGGTGYELRCPREYEAQVSEEGYRWACAVNLNRLSCPTKSIGADPTQPFSFLPSVDLSDLLILDYDFIPDTTHFLQLENPEECVALMLDFLEPHLSSLPASSLPSSAGAFQPPGTALADGGRSKAHTEK